MTVVVGYVATPEGAAALTTAVDEAARLGGRLVVIDSRTGSASEPGDPMESAVAHAEERGVGVDVRQLEHRKDPAEDIIAVAEEVSAQLIVIGLRRRTPVGKLLLGSNAQRILLDAACPVLAVKAQQS